MLWLLNNKTITATLRLRLQHDVSGSVVQMSYIIFNRYQHLQSHCVL